MFRVVCRVPGDFSKSFFFSIVPSVGDKIVLTDSNEEAIACLVEFREIIGIHWAVDCPSPNIDSGVVLTLRRLV